MITSEMSVEYVDHMGTDDSVSNAARVSFHKEASNYTPQQNEKLIKYLAEHGHWSPFSHVMLSLRVKVPLFVAAQLHKHQVGLSVNSVSRRYVDSPPEFYFPKIWRKKADNVKQGSSDIAVTSRYFYDGSEHALTQYGVQEACLGLYENMLEAGVCAEQARMILPQNMFTEFIWSGSLYAFARVCNQRLDPSSQRETQEVAKMIKDVCFEHFPISSKYLIKEL